MSPPPRSTARTLARVALPVIGVLVFAWAAVDPRFRDGEGFLRGVVCAPIALAFAIAIVGASIRSSYAASARWLALELIGFASSLQLIEAGHAIRYQHLAPAWEMFETPWVGWTIVIFIQSLLVVLGLGRQRTRLTEWVTGLTRTQLALIGIVFALTSATVSASVIRYAAELPVATFIQAVNLLNVVLVAAAYPADGLAQVKSWMDSWLGPRGNENTPEPGGIDRFALFAAFWTTLIAAALSIWSYERHPHVPDELSYLMQARYFAKGMLSLPLPPVPAAFNIDLMTYEATRWFSPVPPGWPAALSLGVLVGAPWLVNPVFAGINVLLTYVLVRELSDRRGARLAILLLAASPWYLFMAMSFMPHVVMLTFALASSIGVARSIRTNRIAWALLGGAGVGAASIVRPFDGFVLGAVLGLWLLLRRDWQRRIPSIITYGIGAILVASIVFPYNRLMTGDAKAFPIMAYNDKYYGPKSNSLGFGPERGMGWGVDAYPGHSPVESVINTNLNLFTLNTDLFGWSAGSLVLIALCVAAGKWRRRDRLMFPVILATIGLHAFYWYSGGPDYGPRYWSLILIPCVILTVSGFEMVERNLGAQSGRAIVALASLCIVALLIDVPWRAIDKYHHFRGMRPDIRRLASSVSFGRSLILVEGCRHPDYASAAAYNPLDLLAPVPVYAWDRDDQAQAQVVNAYRDRPVWIVAGPSVTHRGFEIKAGPLTREQLILRPDLRVPWACPNPRPNGP